jgi:hypothetical protein
MVMGGNVWWEKILVVGQGKNAQHTIILPGVFFCRAPEKMRMAKILLAVRPKNAQGKDWNALQTLIFP